MMTPGQSSLAAQARELRQAFDATFAVPPPPPDPPSVALLLVRAGGGLCAVECAGTTGFVRAENFAPAPGRSPAFLGLAAGRGGLHPVWSLAALLGRAPAASGATAWLVLTEAGGAPCALACEALEKMIFVPEIAGGGTPAMAPWGATLVPVADLPALLADIRQRKESTQPRNLLP